MRFPQIFHSRTLTGTNHDEKLENNEYGFCVLPINASRNVDVPHREKSPLSRACRIDNETRVELEKRQRDAWQAGLYMNGSTERAEAVEYSIVFDDGYTVDSVAPLFDDAVLADYIIAKAFNDDLNGVHNVTLNKIMQTMQVIYCGMTGSMLIGGTTLAAPYGPMFANVYNKNFTFGGRGIYGPCGKDRIDAIWARTGNNSDAMRSWIDSAIECCLSKAPYDFSIVLMHDASPYRFARESVTHEAEITIPLQRDKTWGWTVVPDEWIIHNAIAMLSTFAQRKGLTWKPEYVGRLPRS